MKDTNILIENGVDLKKSLELFGDMETYDQMLEDFLKEVDGKINSAKRYLDASDMPNYAIIVHSLKSDCRYFGMEDLALKFYDHELAGKRSDIYFVKENFENLIQEAHKMINILKRYMGVLVEEQATQGVSVQVGAQESILVVDDSNIIRNFIEKIFDGKYKVICAKDGQEAISVVDNTPHDKLMCMFLDLNMPGVDGFQVLEYFKAKNLFSKVPVSIITGNGDAESVAKAFSYGIVDMIQKPFDESKIRDIAEKTIARKEN